MSSVSRTRQAAKKQRGLDRNKGREKKGQSFTYSFIEKGEKEEPKPEKEQAVDVDSSDAEPSEVCEDCGRAYCKGCD